MRLEGVRGEGGGVLGEGEALWQLLDKVEGGRVRDAVEGIGDACLARQGHKDRHGSVDTVIIPLLFYFDVKRC